MGFPAVPLVLAVQSRDGTTLTNTVTATSLLDASGKAALAGGALQVGSKLKWKLRGNMGVGASGAGTMTFDLRYGGTVISNLGAMNLRTSSCAASHFELEIDAICRINSTAAAFECSAKFTGIQALGGTLASTMPALGQLPVAGPSTGSNAVDVSAGGTIDVFGTWSVATSGNTITVNDVEAWQLA